jgi:serine/threonine-protein kinase
VTDFSRTVRDKQLEATDEAELASAVTRTQKAPARTSEDPDGTAVDLWDPTAPEELPVASPPRTLELLGAGGMGIVHTAWDEALGRLVALKRVAAESGDAESRRDFIAEARISGQLQHPNIVPVYALAAAPDGIPYFTMQVIEGCNLTEWLAQPGHELSSPTRLTRGIEILLRVCDALAFAHSRGVLHRDVKPGNIMVGPHGRVYLVDWGLATQSASTNPTDGWIGTPGYAAPEQLRKEVVDARADVFGVGAVLYEVVAGRTPYSDADGPGLWRAVRGDLLPLARAVEGRAVATRLCQIVDRAVAAEPNARYPSIAALQSDLRQFLQGGLHLPRRIAAAGEVVLREGERGDCAYLIIEGRCRVTQSSPQGELELRQMGPGEIFGELALLLDAPRSATVSALTDTTLLVIDRVELQASGALEGWSLTLLEALAQRFSDLERRARGH